jgi:uncharacterized YigZ family protein
MHRRLYSNIETQQVIKKSTFIARLERCLTVEEMPILLQSIRSEHPKASHVCYAYRSLNHEKYHDDGEPSKTAGLPMLQVLRQAQIVDVLAVVIRYYGGINLGAPGLTRAYRSSVAMALKDAQLSTLESMFVVDLELDLFEAQRFLSCLSSDVRILNQSYQDRFKLSLAFHDETDWMTSLQRYPKAIQPLHTETRLIENQKKTSP